tara:strand:- start:372 stop:542 length:171 start_codon:yes stop_codon:yes gene_type:complete
MSHPFGGWYDFFDPHPEKTSCYIYYIGISKNFSNILALIDFSGADLELNVPLNPAF